MTKTYYSKISYVLLIIVFVVFFAPLVLFAINKTLNTKLLFTILGLVITYGFIVYLFFNTKYSITESFLKVSCGIFNYKPIAIASIKTISNSRSLMSSPAASFDRISITYGKWEEIIISPRDKKAFVNHLKSQNSNIKIK